MAAMGASRVARTDESAWALAVGADDKLDDEPDMAPTATTTIATTTPTTATPPAAAPAPPSDADAPKPEGEPPVDALSSSPPTDSRKSAATSRTSTVRTRKSSKQLKALDENGFPIYNIPRSTSWEKLEEAQLDAKNSRDKLRRGSTDKLKRKHSKGAMDALNPEAYLQENWIHRDKLAQIESKELIDIGLRIAGGDSRSSRAPSRARSTRTAKSSIDVTENGFEGEEAFHDAQQSLPVKKTRTKSPSPYDVLNESDELSLTQARSDTSSRPGTSSRLPVANADLPFESPRGGSDENGHARSTSRELNKQKQRLRSQSGGRDLVPTEPDSPLRNSPPKRASSKSQRAPSAARKASAANGVAHGANGNFHGNNASSDSSANSPARPGTSGGARPGTSGGSRPRTRSGPPNPINRPDGDPPWIVDSYKPDPRLPPDQQMLPTHARRMAELQRQAEERAQIEAVERARIDAEERARLAALEAQKRLQEQEYTLLESEDSSANKRNSRVSVNGSLQTDKRQSKRDSGQWPLRTPTPDQQANRLLHQTSGHESPPMVDTNWSHRRNGTIDSVAINGSVSPHGRYSLTPATQTADDQLKRMSQRSRLSQNTAGHHRQLSDQEWKENAAQAPVHQPVTLTPKRETFGHQDKKEKSPGCLGCCTVM